MPRRVWQWLDDDLLEPDAGCAGTLDRDLSGGLVHGEHQRVRRGGDLSALAAVRQYFAAVDVVILGTPYLQIVSCADTATCQAKVSLRWGPGIRTRSRFQLSCTEANGSLDGSIQFSGSPSDHGTCDMPMLQEAALTRISSTELRVDARTHVGDSYPQDAQGVCWSNAIDTTTSSPCTRYDVLTASFVGALPH
jgi:hypothetical protein